MKSLTISELIEELKRHPDQNATVVVQVGINKRGFSRYYENGDVVNVKLAVNSVILEAE